MVIKTTFKFIPLRIGQTGKHDLGGAVGAVIELLIWVKSLRFISMF
jgi:hypothetical protein